MGFKGRYYTIQEGLSIKYFNLEMYTVITNGFVSSANSSTNGNIFQSSRNGSNASATSSSGGNRYKRHLISRPYSPAALVTNNSHDSFAETRVDGSTLPTTPSIISSKTDENTQLGLKETEKGSNLYNKKSRNEGILAYRKINSGNSNDSHLLLSNHYQNIPLQEKNQSSLPPEDGVSSQQSLALKNYNNATNKIYNIDLTPDRFQRLQIENYSVGRSKMEIQQNTNTVPQLQKVTSTCQNLVLTNSIPESPDKCLHINSDVLSSKLNVVHIGSDKGPRDVDVQKIENRKARGYVFHTFGYKSDSNH